MCPGCPPSWLRHWAAYVLLPGWFTCFYTSWRCTVRVLTRSNYSKWHTVCMAIGYSQQWVFCITQDIHTIWTSTFSYVMYNTGPSIAWLQWETTDNIFIVTMHACSCSIRIEPAKLFLEGLPLVPTLYCMSLDPPMSVDLGWRICFVLNECLDCCFLGILEIN